MKYTKVSLALIFSAIFVSAIIAGTWALLHTHPGTSVKNEAQLSGTDNNAPSVEVHADMAADPAPSTASGGEVQVAVDGRQANGNASVTVGSSPATSQGENVSYTVSTPAQTATSNDIATKTETYKDVQVIPSGTTVTLCQSTIARSTGPGQVEATNSAALVVKDGKVIDTSASPDTASGGDYDAARIASMIRGEY